MQLQAPSPESLHSGADIMLPSSSNPTTMAEMGRTISDIARDVQLLASAVADSEGRFMQEINTARQALEAADEDHCKEIYAAFQGCTQHIVKGLVDERTQRGQELQTIRDEIDMLRREVQDGMQAVLQKVRKPVDAAAKVKQGLSKDAMLRLDEEKCASPAEMKAEDAGSPTKADFRQELAGQRLGLDLLEAKCASAVASCMELTQLVQSQLVPSHRETEEKLSQLVAAGLQSDAIQSWSQSTSVLPLLHQDLSALSSKVEVGRDEVQDLKRAVSALTMQVNGFELRLGTIRQADSPLMTSSRRLTAITEPPSGSVGASDAGSGSDVVQESNDGSATASAGATKQQSESRGITRQRSRLARELEADLSVLVAKVHTALLKPSEQMKAQSWSAAAPKRACRSPSPPPTTSGGIVVSATTGPSVSVERAASPHPGATSAPMPAVRSQRAVSPRLSRVQGVDTSTGVTARAGPTVQVMNASSVVREVSPAPYTLPVTSRTTVSSSKGTGILRTVASAMPEGTSPTNATFASAAPTPTSVIQPAAVATLEGVASTAGGIVCPQAYAPSPCNVLMASCQSPRGVSTTLSISGGGQPPAPSYRTTPTTTTMTTTTLYQASRSMSPLPGQGSGGSTSFSSRAPTRYTSGNTVSVRPTDLAHRAWETTASQPPSTALAASAAGSTSPSVGAAVAPAVSGSTAASDAAAGAGGGRARKAPKGRGTGKANGSKTLSL